MKASLLPQSPYSAFEKWRKFALRHLETGKEIITYYQDITTGLTNNSKPEGVGYESAEKLLTCNPHLSKYKSALEETIHEDPILIKELVILCEVLRLKFTSAEGSLTIPAIPERLKDNPIYNCPKTFNDLIAVIVANVSKTILIRDAVILLGHKTSPNMIEYNIILLLSQVDHLEEMLCQLTSGLQTPSPLGIILDSQSRPVFMRIMEAKWRLMDEKSFFPPLWNIRFGLGLDGAYHQYPDLLNAELDFTANQTAYEEIVIAKITAEEREQERDNSTLTTFYQARACFFSQTMPGMRIELELPKYLLPLPDGLPTLQ